MISKEKKAAIIAEYGRKDVYKRQMDNTAIFLVL